MADKDRQKRVEKTEKSVPREKPKQKPGEGFEHRPEPKGLEIEKADRRGYGQDR
jgi:hypothetical protein